MNYYQSILRPLLFSLDAETAHHLTLKLLSWTPSWFWSTPISAPCECMGLQFANPVGLAAGLDKNADYIDALGQLGFGFIEVGGVTKRSQPGNPKPRIFRLPEAQAIINRMNFNNHGVDYVVERLAKRRYRGVVGANICKDNATAIESAYLDYCYCLRKLYPHVDYVSINISCPNSANLQKLQQTEPLKQLLDAIKTEQSRCQAEFRRQVAIAVKLSPDLPHGQVNALAELLLQFEIDAVIASNTTQAREAVQAFPESQQAGGLSGAPLRMPANQLLAQLAEQLSGKIPLIGVGGILSAEDAKSKRSLGASLIQLWTGLVYQGPGLIAECVQALRE